MTDLDAYLPNLSFFKKKRFQLSVRLVSYLLRLTPSPNLTARLGVVHAFLGHYDEAERLLKAALHQDAAQPDAQFYCGVVMEKLGKDRDAMQYYSNAIKQQHADFLDDAIACRNRVTERAGKRVAPRTPKSKKSTPVKHDAAQEQLNAGLQFCGDGRFLEALAAFEAAIAIQPNNPYAYNNRGVVLREFDRLDEGLSSCDEAIKLKADFFEAYNSRGAILRELNRLDEALVGCDRAIELKPDFAEAYNNRGAILQDMNRLDEALSSCGRAIELKPDFAEAYNSRGTILHNMGYFDKAIVNYDRAIELSLNPDLAKFFKSISLLLTGQFGSGWKLYQSGLTVKGNPRLSKHPPRVPNNALWMGEESIAGRRLLIRAEQGLGDTLQFCRYALLAEEKGARVTLAVQRPLVPIVSTLGENFDVVDYEGELPSFDHQCLTMSLPLAFNTSLENIPSTVPYLHSNEAKRSVWRNRLGGRVRPRIGIVWSGSTAHKNDGNRSIPLKLLAPIFELPAEFHSLNKEIRPNDGNDLSAFGQIRQHQADLVDFTDTAALISELDIVISVDTAVAHLAGALGKTVWILIPFVPDFRWMLDRDDSPWYPTARLFRQPKPGDWTSVVREVRDRLHQICLQSN